MVFALAGDSTMTRRRPMTGNTVARLSSGASVRSGRILATAWPDAPRPSLFYLVVGGLSWPVLRGLFRQRATGQRAPPARPGATSSRRTTSRTSIRGRSACRSSRAATCASWGSRSCSGSRSAWSCAPAARSRSGADSATTRRSRPRCSCAASGHVVVMFPEGTRRSKGLRKKHEARWRSGAARIALEAGVPLVPAGIARHRPSVAARPRSASRTVRRSPSTISPALELSARRRRVATERLCEAIERLEASLA